MYRMIKKPSRRHTGSTASRMITGWPLCPEAATSNTQIAYPVSPDSHPVAHLREFRSRFAWGSRRIHWGNNAAMAIVVRVLGGALLILSAALARPALRYVDSAANKARTEAFRPGHGGHEFAAQKVATGAVLSLLAIVGVTLLVAAPS
jgi:uncharacterized membrane protein